MKTAVVQLRCKHPLRAGAKFCHVCGTDEQAIHGVSVEPSDAEINQVVATNSAADWHDLQRIRAKADAICLDGEVWNLQKQFTQHRFASPDPGKHLGAMAGAICAAIISLLLFEFGKSAIPGWSIRLGVLTAALGIALSVRFVSLRRAFKTSHAAWLSEYRRLDTELIEKWGRSRGKTTSAGQ